LVQFKGTRPKSFFVIASEAKQSGKYWAEYNSDWDTVKGNIIPQKGLKALDPTNH
jgi:hypothetical protein